MGKIKWASTKLLSFQHKDVKEFRSYMKFVYNDFLNHENIFHEYLLNPTRSPNQDQSLHSEEHSDHDTNNTSNPTLNHSNTTSKNEDKEFHPIASIDYFPKNSSKSELLVRFDMTSCYDQNGYPESQRAPIDLCFALDVSESMSKHFPGYGFTLLEMALRQIFFTVKKLTSLDRVSLILFCAEEREIFPLTACTETNKHLLMQLLSSINSKKSTWSCLGRGLAAAFVSLSPNTTASEPSTEGIQRVKRVVYFSNFAFPIPEDISANETQFVTLISNALYGHITPPLSVPSFQRQVLSSRGRTQGIVERITQKTFSPQNAIYVSIVAVGNGMLSINCRQEICQIIGAKYYSFQNEMVLENLISHDMVPVASNITLRFPSSIAIHHVYGSSEFTYLNPIYAGYYEETKNCEIFHEISISSEFPSPTPNILVISLRPIDKDDEKCKVNELDCSNSSQFHKNSLENRNEMNLNVFPRKRLRYDESGDDDLNNTKGEGWSTIHQQQLSFPLHVEWRDMSGNLHTEILPLDVPNHSQYQKVTQSESHETNFSITTSPSSISSPDFKQSIIQPAIGVHQTSPLSSETLSELLPITPLSEAYVLLEYVDCIQYYIQCISTDLMNKLLNNDFSETEMYIPDHVIVNIRHLKQSGNLYSLPSLHVTGLLPSANGSSLSDSLLFYHIILMKLIRCQRSLARTIMSCTNLTTTSDHDTHLFWHNQVQSSSSTSYEDLSFHSTMNTFSQQQQPGSSSLSYRFLYDSLVRIITMERIEYEKCLTHLMTSIERKKFEELCPKQYFCPISLTIMKHPVIAYDGYSYEEEHILKWFRTGNITSPVTNHVVPSTQIIINYTLKGLIDDFMEKFHHNYLDNPVTDVSSSLNHHAASSSPPPSTLTTLTATTALSSQHHQHQHHHSLSFESLSDSGCSSHSSTSSSTILKSIPTSQILITNKHIILPEK